GAGNAKIFRGLGGKDNPSKAPGSLGNTSDALERSGEGNPQTPWEGSGSVGRLEGSQAPRGFNSLDPVLEHLGEYGKRVNESIHPKAPGDGKDASGSLEDCWEDGKRRRVRSLAPRCTPNDLWRVKEEGDPTKDDLGLGQETSRSFCSLESFNEVALERVWMRRVAPDPGGELVFLGNTPQYVNHSPWKGGILLDVEGLEEVEVTQVERLLVCGDLYHLKKLRLNGKTLMHLGEMHCQSAEISGEEFRQWSAGVTWNQQRITLRNSDWSYGPPAGHGRTYEHIRWQGARLSGDSDHPLLSESNGVISLPNVRFGGVSTLKALTFSCKRGVYTDPLEVDYLTLCGNLKVAGDTQVKVLAFGAAFLGGLPRLEVGPLRGEVTLSYCHGMGWDHRGTEEYLRSVRADIVMTEPALARIQRIAYRERQPCGDAFVVGTRGALTSSVQAMGCLVNRGGFLTVHGILDQRQVMVVHQDVTLLGGQGQGSSVS
ncbi:hypothetical protein, partial [Holospora curviuscula]|uniref:hypothetical protein n=1 Tax=Holospora curviuscula TaxID=1082868 RepID=UPI0013FDA919